MNIITISGKATHGKDFTADILKDILLKDGKRVLIMHYADYLKFLCKYIYEWDGKKDDKGRTILQFVGTNLARNNNPDIWVKVVYETILAFRTEYDVFIIPDTRFPNEIDFFKSKLCDISSIRVNRLNYKSSLTEEQLNHPSETALNDYVFDYNIDFETGRENVINAIKESGLLGKI
jgi:hypothetical protein